MTKNKEEKTGLHFLHQISVRAMCLIFKEGIKKLSLQTKLENDGPEIKRK